MQSTVLKLTEHFTVAEMQCKCGRDECEAVPMDARFMADLEAYRVAWGRPIYPTSACRCPYWNRQEGGKAASLHPLGLAVDFRTRYAEEKYEMVALAIRMGFT